MVKRSSSRLIRFSEMISATVAEGATRRKALYYRHFDPTRSLDPGLDPGPGRTGDAARVSARTYAKLLQNVARSSLRPAAAASYGLPLQSIP